MVWNKILGFFKKAQSPKVIVSGLKKDAKVFQDSVEEEARAFADKASKFLDEIEGVTIHVKSSGIGKTEKFELHGLLSSKSASFHAKAAGRKLNFVLNDLFDELLSEARKHKSRLVDGKKRRNKFVLDGGEE
ncbi:MAG: hypothetical protein QXR53_02290 [Candidatus Norongarragalinales archaeon]